MEPKDFSEPKPEISKKLSLEERLSKVHDYEGAVYICQHLNDFLEFSHKEVAMKLIEAGKGGYVAYNLGKFSGLDHKEVAMKLIEAGEGGYVADNLGKFSGLNHKEVAMKLIEAGKGGYVAIDASSFNGLDKEVIMKLIETKNVYYVVRNLNNFSGLDKEVAMEIIKVGEGEYMVKSLEKFSGLDKEVAMELIKVGEGWYVARNLKKFSGLDKEVALEIIKAGEGRDVAENLEKFSGLDQEVAMALIKAGEGRDVAENLEKFSGLNHKEVATALIKASAGKYVSANLEKFSDLNHKEVVMELIKVGAGRDMDKNFKKFSGLDQEVAMALIKVGDYFYVTNYLERFSGLDKEVAMILIKSRQGDAVINNLEKFMGLDKEVAMKLIEVGQGDAVAKNLKMFGGLDYKEVAMKLIELEQGDAVAKNLEMFGGLDYKEVAMTLINANQGNAVVKNLEKFIGLDHKELAMTLINTKQEYVVEKNLEKFSGLDKEVAMALIKLAKGPDVVRCLKNFKGLNHKEVLLALLNFNSGRLRINEIRYFKNFTEFDKDLIIRVIDATGDSHYEYKELFDNLILSEHQKREILHYLLLRNDFQKSKTFVEKLLANQPNVYFAVAEQVVNLKISSGDVENAKTICLIFGLKDVLKKFREKYPNKSIPNVIYLYFGEKTDWQEKLGEKPVNEFLDVLPKSKERDEKRNAFTHNEYDRTSEFLQYLNKYELFNVNDIDFEIATDFIKHYGLAKSVLLYEYFRNLHLFNMGKLDNLPPEQVYEDEITSLEILEEKYKTLQMKVFSSQEITADYLKTLSHFEITLLAQITGKNTHRFDTGRQSFDKIIKDFIAYSEKTADKSREQESSSQDNDYSEYDDYDNNYDDDDYYQNEYVPTPEEYKPFKLQANKVEYEFDHSNLEKLDSSYNILKKDVLKIFSTETADKDKFLSLKTSSAEKIQAKIKELENKTDNQYIAQQREKLMAVIAKLEILDFKEIKEKGEIKSKSYDELLLELLDLDKSMIERSGLQDELRQIVFRKMLDQSYGTVDRVERIRTSMQGELNALGILHLLDLIDNFAKDHILNTEKDNKEKYWTDEAWKKIKESNKLDSKFTMKVVFNKQHKELKEVADKMTALDSGKGNFKIQCCPDRGFIGEMSGYLADVCYTAEYPLLARHPNLVPYKFIAEQDSDNKEFLGSVLVFELEDNDNNKVALLRAFDIPREHEVNVGEFIENFINKITPSLQARGVKKIIIPGDDGAISNYPLTISHMHKEYINGQNRMSLGKHFAFNGHDLTDNCYVARKI